MDQKTFITFEGMNWYALILSLPVPRWAGTNTDLPINSNFSKMLRVNLHRAFLNPLNANSTKWSNTLKQFVGKLPTNCLSVFDHFVKLALKGLNSIWWAF